MSGYDILTVEGVDAEEIAETDVEIFRKRSICVFEGYVAVELKSGTKDEYLEVLSNLGFLEGKRFALSHCSDTTGTGFATLYRMTDESIEEIVQTSDVNPSEDERFSETYTPTFQGREAEEERTRFDGTKGRPAKRYLEEEHDFEVKMIWDLRGDGWTVRDDISYYSDDL